MSSVNDDINVLNVLARKTTKTLLVTLLRPISSMKNLNTAKVLVQLTKSVQPLFQNERKNSKISLLAQGLTSKYRSELCTVMSPGSSLQLAQSSLFVTRNASLPVSRTPS